MVIAAVGTVLAAGYLLWLYQRTAFGEPTEEFSGHASHAPTRSGAAANPTSDHDDIHDVKLFEWIAWTPLLIGIVVLGVYPQLLFKIIDPAVSQLTRGVREVADARFVARRRWLRVATRRLPRARARDRARRRHLPRAARRPVRRRAASDGSLATLAGFVLLGAFAAGRHARRRSAPTSGRCSTAATWSTTSASC